MAGATKTKGKGKATKNGATAAAMSGTEKPAEKPAKVASTKGKPVAAKMPKGAGKGGKGRGC